MQESAHILGVEVNECTQTEHSHIASFQIKKQKTSNTSRRLLILCYRLLYSKSKHFLTPKTVISFAFLKLSKNRII